MTTQLIRAPDGTLWTTSSQVSLRDIFPLQDELVDRIVKALALPLTSREQRALKHDVPANAMAYDLYLRGYQLVTVPQTWPSRDTANYKPSEKCMSGLELAGHIAAAEVLFSGRRHQRQVRVGARGIQT